jgi:hypothetical protein
MKKARSTINVIFVLMLLMISLEPSGLISVKAQSGDMLPQPAPSGPAPIRPHIQLKSTGGDTQQTVTQGIFPDGPLSEWINSSAIAGDVFQATPDVTGNNPAMQPLQSIDNVDHPEQALGCYNYLKNSDFELNSDWSANNNVWYTNQYRYQGNRSMYMSTYNPNTRMWYNPAAWQLVQIPAQVGSMFIRFRTTALIDAGDGAWVTVWDKNFANVLWYGVIPYTQTSWTELVAWLPQNILAGKEVNITFQLQYDSDYIYSDLYLDVVELGICDAGTQPPPENSTSRVIPVNISLYKVASPSERQAYQEIMGYFADGIYEMSNGKHQIGTVTITQNWNNWSTTHVQWWQSAHPVSALNGYSSATKDPASKVTFGDVFDNVNFLDPSNYQAAGYALAHEFGHYYYGLADEYQASADSPCSFAAFWCPRPDDIAVKDSVMNYQWAAVDNRGGDLNYLNFSIPKNNTKRNAQQRTYSASGWETLVRPSTQDQPLPLEAAKNPRTYFPELASAAPKGNDYPSHELPAGQTAARSKLGNIVWVAPTSSPEAAADYLAGVSSIAGDTIAYPKAVILVASVANLQAIAQAALQAQVSAPGGGVSPLTLKDDGIAPDEIANDGRFSGFMPYNQNGVYSVDVTFTNPSNSAVYTTIGLADSDWALGDPVGENFNANASTSITITNFSTDDHSDTTNGATPIYTDNQPWPAKVDRAGDADMFHGNLLGNGIFVFRMSNFAEGIQPRVRFWAEDGLTPLGDFVFTPQSGYYYIFYIEGNSGDKFYAEITNNNPEAASGRYDISFGRALDGELQYITFIPITVK